MPPSGAMGPKVVPAAALPAGWLVSKVNCVSVVCAEAVDATASMATAERVIREVFMRLRWSSRSRSAERRASCVEPPRPATSNSATFPSPRPRRQPGCFPSDILPSARVLSERRLL